MRGYECVYVRVAGGVRDNTRIIEQIDIAKIVSSDHHRVIVISQILKKNTFAHIYTYYTQL